MAIAWHILATHGPMARSIAQREERVAERDTRVASKKKTNKQTTLLHLNQENPIRSHVPVDVRVRLVRADLHCP